MSVYRTLTVEAQLSNNQVNADAEVSENNIEATAELINEISVNYVSDYDLLSNKPQINNVTLQGNKSLDDIGIEDISNLELELILRT